MKIKVKKQIGTYKPDEIVEVEEHKGIPLDVFWRRRLADAEFDQCCEIVKETHKPKSSKLKESKE